MTGTERCDREIAEILERPDVVGGQAPAWLVVLGTEDWAEERKMIMESQRQELRTRYMREANGASWIDWIEERVLAAEARIAELTVDESPRQAAMRIVEAATYDWEPLVDAITTAIQAASNAQLERGRAALIGSMEEQLRLAKESRERFEAAIAEAREKAVAAIAMASEYEDMAKQCEAQLEHERGYIDGLKHTAQVAVEDAYANRHIQHVREFMAKFSQHIGEAPGWPPQEVLEAKLRRVTEEFCELIAACGYKPHVQISNHDGEWVIEDEITAGRDTVQDLPHAVREAVDLEYSTHHLMISCGVDTAEPWTRVCAANMRKELRDGQPVKPEGWQAPDIAGALREQGWGGAE